MDDLKDFKKKIESEIGKKTKADKKMGKLKRDLLNAAFNTFRDERLLAGGVFELQGKDVLGKNRFNAWISDFAGMKEILDAYGMAHAERITLVTESYEEERIASRLIRIFWDRGEMSLHFGDHVKLPYLKAVVREYGLQVEISGISKILEGQDKRYTGLMALRDKLIQSGMAMGIPMCDLDGFKEEYLAIEERYARMLHAAFKSSAFDHSLKTHRYRELQHDFDLMQTDDLRLFMDMGRAMYKEIRNQDAGIE